MLACMPVRFVVFAVAALAFAGCAGHPTATDSMAGAEVALAEASAIANGKASDDLDRALRKLAWARRWAAAGDHRPAVWLAEQARVDAELAAALAAAEVARERVSADEAAGGPRKAAMKNQ